MDLLSALVEAGSLPSELLQHMLSIDAASTVKEQQVSYTFCVYGCAILTLTFDVIFQFIRLGCCFCQTVLSVVFIGGFFTKLLLNMGQK